MGEKRKIWVTRDISLVGRGDLSLSWARRLISCLGEKTYLLVGRGDLSLDWLGGEKWRHPYFNYNFGYMCQNSTYDPNLESSLSPGGPLVNLESSLSSYHFLLAI